MRSRIGREFRRKRTARGDNVVCEQAIRRWIAASDARAHNCDGPAASTQGRLMRRGIDPHRHPRNHRDLELDESLGGQLRTPNPVVTCLTRTDNCYAGSAKQRSVAEMEEKWRRIRDFLELAGIACSRNRMHTEITAFPSCDLSRTLLEHSLAKAADE